MIHELCGQHHTSYLARWFCAARRAHYGRPDRAPRRNHEEVALERRQRGESIARRREFNRKKRAEREARRLAKQQNQEAAA